VFVVCAASARGKIEHPANVLLYRADALQNGAPGGEKIAPSCGKCLQRGGSVIYRAKL
jgi:hypothetical protein